MGTKFSFKIIYRHDIIWYQTGIGAI